MTLVHTDCFPLYPLSSADTNDTFDLCLNEYLKREDSIETAPESHLPLLPQDLPSTALACRVSNLMKVC